MILPSPLKPLFTRPMKKLALSALMMLSLLGSSQAANLYSSNLGNGLTLLGGTSPVTQGTIRFGVFPTGFDFNANPTSAVLGQFNRHTLTWNIFDVIIADEANEYNVSPLAAVCIQIKEKYVDTGITPTYRLQVTGDASGKYGSADRQKAQTYYSTIARYLKLNESQIVVRDANLTHILSGDLINEAFNKLPKGHVNLCDVPDLEKDIKRSFPDKDKSLNEAKSKFGLHILDAWRYLMDLWFGHINGYWTSSTVEIQDNILTFKRRIESLKNAA